MNNICPVCHKSIESECKNCGFEMSHFCGKSVTTSANNGFVWIEPGTFMMGSPSSEPVRSNDEVQHKVTLSAFYMSKYNIIC